MKKELMTLGALSWALLACTPQTQYAKAGHHVYAATTVQSADVCLLQSSGRNQD